MTTEEYFKLKLKVGDKLKRASDGKIFELIGFKDVKEVRGNTERQYTLKAPNGYQFPCTSHFIDCSLEKIITNSKGE